MIAAERASEANFGERTSVAERASEANSGEEANERAVHAKE